MSSYNNGVETRTPERKKVTLRTLRRKKRDGTPISMLTAYDYSSAMLVDRAGTDMLLVGDSLAQVMLGMEDTVSLTLDEMLVHFRSVARAAKYTFKVGDMPFGSYNITIEEAVRNAVRIMKEGRMEAVKLEGGIEVAETVRAITRAGIPVVGHIGLTPQTISQLSGYRIQVVQHNRPKDYTKMPSPCRMQVPSRLFWNWYLLVLPITSAADSKFQPSALARAMAVTDRFWSTMTSRPH